MFDARNAHGAINDLSRIFSTGFSGPWYINFCPLEANLTERMVQEAKHEEKILLNKLAKIRGELKDITKEVEQISNHNSIIEN